MLQGMMVKWVHSLLILSFLAGCSGFQEAEAKKVRERNLTTAPIQRQSNETFFALPPVEEKKIPLYPWEARRIGSHLRITKEFFRCKGEILNPPIQLQRNNQIFYHLDCGGIEKHSLPIRDGKEFIYPILIAQLHQASHRQQGINPRGISSFVKQKGRASRPAQHQQPVAQHRWEAPLVPGPVPTSKLEL